MADEEQEVVVTIEPDAAATAPEIEKKPDAAVAKPDTGADDPVKALKAQYVELEAKAERDRKAREDADRRASESAREATRFRQEATTARSQVVDSQLDTITTALESAQSEVTAAKRDIKLAGESGDYEALADAQERLSRAAANALRFDEAKADLETKKAAKPVERTEAQQGPTDPVEAYVQGRKPQTADWLRSHPEYVTEPRKNLKLNAAHTDALAEGHTPDSADYFEYVEKFLGIRQGEVEKTASKTPAKRATPTVAPVNASGGGTNGGSGNEVRLTAGEAKAAVDGTHIYNYDDPSPKKAFKKGDPIGVQEFARRKLLLTKQGAYDRSYTEG